MQQLHLVGLTTDLDSLICSARKGAKSGSFVLPLDEHLLQVIAEAVSRRNADGVELEVPEALQPATTAPRRQSHLSPREIQDRLRAGRSLEEIAAEAGVGEEWVARFAAPVEAERSQVVGRARRLVYDRPRRGDSGEPLGMSVRWNLADRGVRLTNDEFDASWSAYQLADAAWMVTFTFESRKREHEAEWEVDLATNELLSRNRLATELGYVEPGRRRRAMTSLQPVASATAMGRARAMSSESADDARGEDAARSAPTVPGPPKRAGSARKATPVGRSLAKKATSGGRGSAPRKATTGRGAAKKSSTTGRSPAARTSGGRAAAVKRAPTRTAAKKAGGRAGAGPAKRAGTAGRAVAAKKSTSRTTTRRTGRGAPPAAAALSRPTVDDRPVPNELGRRRLQLVSGGAPTPRRAGAARGRPATGMPAVRIAAARSGDVAAAQRRADRPVRPGPEIIPPEPGLDVSDSEAAAEARRAERRRARAARTQGGPDAIAPDAIAPAPAPAAARASRPSAGGGDDGDDGRVVTIRANRASPPRGDAELILPADRPSLRPAQPATQPRKRLFSRPGR
ncbi:MAG TPA: septation protein SepH [Acidimicrobiales bacterium]|nr:septation protein SepH [Acidimicrobiales bacterium]